MDKKKAQQEIVGFVLIVVIVVVGLMVFLLISIGNNPEVQDSLEVKNMLSSILRTTSSCAIVYEPDYDSYEDLFKSCHKNKVCSNLGENSCEHLKENLEEIIDELIKSEAKVESYQIDFLKKDNLGEIGVFQIVKGTCGSGIVNSAQKAIVSGSETVIVRLKICFSG